MIVLNLEWNAPGILPGKETLPLPIMHTNTFKCLIAVTPSGGECFVSDLFEGDIDDVRIFKESGLLKHLKPYDLVLADRGFTVQDLLNPLQVQLKIPSF